MRSTTEITTVRMPSSMHSDTREREDRRQRQQAAAGTTLVVMRPPASTIVPIDVISEPAKKFHGSTPARRKNANVSIPLGSPGSGVILKYKPSMIA